jgi:hypothetical protein
MARRAASAALFSTASLFIVGAFGTFGFFGELNIAIGLIPLPR